MATTMIPSPATDDFLASCGWAGAIVSPLAGDASFRRYFRVKHGDRDAVLMDAPPEHEDSRPFIYVAEWLNAHGFRAPRILARDLDAGLLLLEDFGDRLMRPVLDEYPAQEMDVYTRVVDELTRLHTLPAADLRLYDMAEYLREARLLTEWYAPAVGATVDIDDYDQAWQQVLAPLLAGDDAYRVTVLRDYHAENLMLLDDGGIGLLDFQDALAGHPAYDLVSLLQDARRVVSPQVEGAMIDYYRTSTGASDDFERAYAVLGAQRNAKIIGIFTRLHRRDGKARYLKMIPHMWQMLERDLAQPALAPVKQWFDANLPPMLRIEPSEHC